MKISEVDKTEQPRYVQLSSNKNTTNMPPRPPISPEKRRERYLEAVRDKMAKLYAYGEAKPPAREQLWHEITGFLEAGRITRQLYDRRAASHHRRGAPHSFRYYPGRTSVKAEVSDGQMMSKTGISTMCRLRCGDAICEALDLH